MFSVMFLGKGSPQGRTLDYRNKVKAELVMELLPIQGFEGKWVCLPVESVNLLCEVVVPMYLLKFTRKLLLSNSTYMYSVAVHQNHCRYETVLLCTRL